MSSSSMLDVEATKKKKKIYVSIYICIFEEVDKLMSSWLTSGTTFPDILNHSQKNCYPIIDFVYCYQFFYLCAC